MQRNFLRGLLICVLPCALFGAFAVLKEYRKGIDLAGGTILKYEVDLDKLRRNQRAVAGSADDIQGLSSDQMQQLAESLKRRIDPADLKNVIIRPVGDSRIEIILPFTPGVATDGTKKKGASEKEGASEDFVAFVQSVLRQVGVLEFRILANEADDAAGLAAAEDKIKSLSADDALSLAKAGLPPPPPDGAPFTVAIGDVEATDVAYEWNELSQEERKSLHLDNASATDPEKNQLWTRLAAARGKTVIERSGDRDGKVTSMLLYSREFKKENPPKDEEGKKVEYFVLTRVSSVDRVKVEGEVTLNARPSTDDAGNRAIGFSFNGAGANKFGAMTRRNKPAGQNLRYLAVLLDDKVVSAPTLNVQLSDGGIIKGPPTAPGRPGGFSREYVDRIVYILRSGALSAALKPDPVSVQTVGPTLGQDTINKGLTAVGLSFLTVMAFMVVYYRVAGVIACVALLANLLLTVGLMVAMNAAFTLAGLAGIVLMLGMAVDANVLIYERLREERTKGATLAAAIRNGYDRALPTIIDTHLSSIFTAVILYAFGNDNLKGFSISLTSGLVISLFTSLYMTRLMFDYALARKWTSELKMMQLFPRPNISFMKIRWQMLTLTAISSVVGLGLFLYRGESVLNVDFTQGTKFGGRLAAPLPLSGDGGLRDLLSEERQRERLKVSKVIPAVATDADPDRAAKGGGQSLTDKTYQIFYDGAEPVTVTLANALEDKAAQAQQLETRAAGLPDVSVEQLTIGGEDVASGSTRSFNLRTTEREKELVQVMLDRLLRDQSGRPLLATVTVQTPATVTGPAAELAFAEPTSLSYVEGILQREFALAYRVPQSGPAFELTGVPAAEGSDERKEQLSTKKFKRMTVSVAKNAEFAAVAGADAKAAEDKKALADILTKFKAAFESRPLPESLETFDPTLANETKTKALYAIGLSWLAM
jgi:SecD/SecF fusion protein